MTENLKEMSDRATQGEWHVDWLPAWNEDNGAEEPPICDGICIHTPEHEAESVLCCSEREAAFIVALVNAFRAGRLHDDTALATAVARARREALEEAAAVAEAYDAYSGRGTEDRNDLMGMFARGNQRAKQAIVKAIRSIAATPHEARQTETGWKDIASAPKDKTAVIIAVPSLHAGQPMIVGEAYFDPEHDGWWWAGQSWGDYYASPIAETNAPPALWQPMPSPPHPAIGNLEREGRS